MIKREDLDQSEGQYRYGSELFGVYQTLDHEVRKEARRMLDPGEPAGDQCLDRLASLQVRSQRTVAFLEHESRTAGQLRILRDSGAAGELKRGLFQALDLLCLGWYTGHCGCCVAVGSHRVGRQCLTVRRDL
jgi:hypothetical protein